MLGDKIRIQKLLDCDAMRQKYRGVVQKTRKLVAPDLRQKQFQSLLDRRKLGEEQTPAERCRIPKPGLQSRIGPSLDVKHEKRLELNTSFERDYIGSPYCREAENEYVNFRDYEGRTALHAAALKDNYEAVRLLIYNNASVFLRDRKSQVRIVLLSFSYCSLI